MVSNYELIEKLERLPFFNALLKSGIVAINWIDYKVIYEFYTIERDRLEAKGFSKAKSRGSAVTTTADEYNISERNVYLIIKKME